MEKGNIKPLISFLQAGHKTFAQNSLSCCGKGMVSFLTVIFSAVKNEPHEECDLVVADKNGSVVASAVLADDLNKDPKPELLTVNGEGPAAFATGTNYENEKSNLYTAIYFATPGKKPVLGESSSMIEDLGETDNIDHLCYAGSDLYFVTTDTHKTVIKFGSGVKLIVGTKQLDPVQLKMMGLDPSIASAATVWKVDNDKQNNKVKISNGHDLTVRNCIED